MNKLYGLILPFLMVIWGGLGLNAQNPCTSTIQMSCGQTYTASLVPNSGSWSNYTGVTYTYSGSEQVWSFTAPSTGAYTFNLNEGTADADFFLMDACSNTAGNLSSGYWSGLSNMTVTLTGGVTYYLIADLYSSSATTVTVSVDCSTSSAPPNDLCSGAIELPCGTINLAGTTVNTTSISDPMYCASSYGVWYKFTGDGQATTISSTATFDHEMVISSGSCGSLTNIVCRDGSTGTETYTFTPTNGIQYYVYIAHWSTSNSTTGTFTISRTCTAPPTCSADMSINTTTYSNTGLTTCGFGNDFSSSDACNSSYMGGEDIVIAYTPTTSGCVNIALSNTASWTGLFVLNNCPNITGASCLENSTSSSGNPSINGFSVTANTTYYIVVSTWPSPYCTDFDLDITSCPPPPTNDECSGAISVPVNPDLNCGNVTAGTISLATPSSQTTGCSGTANDDVWFSFVATNTVHHIDLLNVSGSPTDLYHSVYGGTCSSIGSPLVCSDPNNSVVSGLTPGNTYYIRVYSWSSSSGATTNFNVCVGTPPPPPPPPSNDECSGAIELPCGTTNLAGTTVNTTNISDPINCASSYGVWYKFTGDGQETTISSTATFDHEMVIYSGSCGSLTNIVCRDWSTGTETYTFTTTSGTQYYVYIGHYSTSSSTTGTFTISRTCPSNTGDDIIPTACATATYTLQPNSTIHFYDDGGPGGECFTQGAPGNYANSNCITMTTICAAPGQFLIVDFLALSMMNTTSGFDWLVIYDGPGTSGPQLFNNRAGQADNDRGSYCYFYDNNDALSLCSTSQCLTFEFFASSTVDYEGWDALITSTPVQCSPLPVELSHFSANCDKHVILSWATESELNSEKFIVEKSRSGAHWEVVDEVDAAGNSNSHLAYSLTDYNPNNGISYYRLRQVDFDGKEEVFGPISANCEGIDNSMIAYPNPNNGNFTVEINSSVEINDAVIQLADMTGKIVSSQVVQVANGVSQISIEKSEYLNRGTYVLKVLNAEKYFSPIKVVVR